MVIIGYGLEDRSNVKDGFVGGFAIRREMENRVEGESSLLHGKERVEMNWVVRQAGAWKSCV